MTEPPPRKRFQIHLSTAIVMMFVAGVLAYVNVRPRMILREDIGKPNRGAFSDSFGYGYEKNCVYGWPVHFCVDNIAVGGTSHMNAAQYAKQHAELLREDNLPLLSDFVWPPRDWYYGELAVDIVVGLAILFAVYFLCEWLIRRAARKGA